MCTTIDHCDGVTNNVSIPSAPFIMLQYCCFATEVVTVKLLRNHLKGFTNETS